MPSQIELSFDIAREDDYWIYYTYNCGAAFKHYYGGGLASGKIKVDIPISRLKGQVLSTTTAFWDYEGLGSNESIVYFTVVTTPAGQVQPQINRTGKRITCSGAVVGDFLCAGDFPHHRRRVGNRQ